MTLLDTLQIETGPNPTATILWLHGLGADGHDFESIVPELAPRSLGAVRFLLPHAPVRPVTLNNGMRMRAWYDIATLERHDQQDEAGLRTADAALHALIRRENERGVATRRIVLAGFSQGGALALYAGTRYPESLAGIIALSCYLPLAGSLVAERAAANAATAIFLAHGSYDGIVDPLFGEETRAALQAAGYPVEWHSYPMAHAVCAEELTAVAAFVRRVLAPPA